MNRCQPCPQPGEVLREDGLLIGYVETDDLASAQRGMASSGTVGRWNAVVDRATADPSSWAYGRPFPVARLVEVVMSHPIVHAEIRSADPDGTRRFFGSLFGWTYPTEGAFPGYTFVETGVPGALYTAISPLQGDGDLVTFFVGVQNIQDTIADTLRLGGRVVQEPVTVPGVAFALIADPQGHIIGLAQQL
jgi:predicted enzyme related to lactoylglutathione lyase